jgi:DNA-binding MarR family transcriptional regulator
MKKYDFSRRFGFVVGEVGRLYGRQFDQRAREDLALSRAQCRLLAVVAADAGKTWSQADLAQALDLTPMGVTTLCDRMEAGGWIARRPSATDRRVNTIELQAKAGGALDEALAIGDEVQQAALAGFSAAERRQLVGLLQRVRANLSGAHAADTGEPAQAGVT